MSRSIVLEVPEAVRAIARRLESAGYETWTVGGAVRDALLGRRRADWDLATAARPDDVRRLFRPSYPIGVQFGTIGVRGEDGQVYEVTTFRRDLETDGRHAVVEYADTLDDDLARRDFTINAIAYHPLRDELKDPFGGVDDLKSGVLRCVGDPAERFAEDYLRVLRGLRFAGRYGLEIEPETWKQLEQATERLSRLSGERVREELVKVLSDRGASRTLDLYRRSGALAAVLPPLSSLDDAEWNELLRTVDAISARRPWLRMAALLAPAKHELDEIARRLRFSNAELKDSAALIAALELPLPAGPEDEVGARAWLRSVGRDRAYDVWRVHVARARARGATEPERTDIAERARLVRRILQRRDPVALGDLAIDGHDLQELGLSPGPEFARILEECLDAVVRDPDLNERGRLLERVRERYVR